ncbi:hypothetical protein NZD89_02530 [Alicyclobacillus fastidiosus]|uniref:Uncharacterized protein n=2 Tax=Alicyclobacillus fastidiosus TaxID=392011 RepID=A0ABY6ZND3_9BACL|nr:hypothetical protein [Alicyclobacillus fastidiosus]WAH44483.1 hypothetical protein NZD89_02530 [Alicyclobacillus fastidiosus]
MAKLDRILSSWSGAPKKGALFAIKKYGLPDELTRSMLIWHYRRPWKCIVIHRDPVPHNFPMPHPDFFEQTINYRVPPELFDEVGKYDGSVRVDRTKGEASAKCDKEPMNILALNLLNDIVVGKRSVEEARMFYAEQAIQFNVHHKPSPYTSRLLFPIPTDTADPDKPVVTMEPRIESSKDET